MQKFKGDDLELKFINSGGPIFDLMSMGLDDFFDGAYSSGPLGDLLHEDDRSPLSNAIVLDIFRTSFNTIYEAFAVSGSFESYLTVFREIFGSDVVVEFTVTAPGKLTIAITAEHLTEDLFIARHVVSDAYAYDNVKWYDTSPDSGRVIFQSVKGFKTQYELEQMLFEMVPDGIFTTITLTFGV